MSFTSHTLQNVISHPFTYLNSPNSGLRPETFSLDDVRVIDNTSHYDNEEDNCVNNDYGNFLLNTDCYYHNNDREGNW